MTACYCTDPDTGKKLWVCDTDLCRIQDKCKYGFVLPYRCRYISYLGCDCGAYPPIKKEIVNE